MSMDRRSFLKSSAAAAFFMPFARRARAQASAPPFLVTVEAKGGWDPTYFCDPVADPLYSFFGAEHILQAGALRYAPFTVEGGVVTPYLVNGVDFFAKHAERLLVIRGVDNRTVSHIVGPRVAFAGTTRPGLPTLDALVAGAYDPEAALALISAGGEVATEGLVPLTLGNDLRIIRRAFRPNATDPTNPASTLFQDAAVHDLVRSRQRARDDRLRASLLAPRDLAATDRLSRQRSAEMVERLDALALAFDDAAAVGGVDPLIQASAGALAAMRAGECVAAHVVTRGFDSHGGHDSFSQRTGHRPSLSRLFAGLDFLIDGIAADPALAARGAIVFVASDFGRTVMNAEDGKDHWPITSVMIFGVGAAESLVGGGRVIGETAPFAPDGSIINGARARNVRVAGNALVVADDDDPAGIPLTSGHVHVALRALFAAQGADPQGIFARFPVPGVDQNPLPFFG
jgi:uncharacterized protein (DUF1501 family)